MRSIKVKAIRSKIYYFEKLEVRTLKEPELWTQHRLVRAEVNGFIIETEKEKVYNRISIHKLKIEENTNSAESDAELEPQGKRKTS